MPQYLSSNRHTLASILWAPFSWLVQILAFGIIASAIAALAGFREGLESSTAMLLLGLLPTIGLIGSAAAATIVTRRHRDTSIGRLEIFLRSFVWFFSFPARGWVMGFGWALVFIFVHAVPIVISIIGLLISWWAISTMIGMGANGWLIVLVGIVLPLLTVGGTVWGNQYGSGVSGGLPIGCVLAVALGVIVGFLWLCILIAVLALFALPALLVVFGIVISASGSVTLNFLQWAIALGVFGGMLLFPLLVEKPIGLRTTPSTAG